MIPTMASSCRAGSASGSGPADPDSPAGEAFFEPADAIVLGSDNASDREPASFAAFYLLGPTDTMLVRELP